MEVKASDKVIYFKYAGTEMEVEEEELLMPWSNDILATIT